MDIDTIGIENSNVQSTRLQALLYAWACAVSSKSAACAQLRATACLTWCRVPDWRDRLFQLYDIATEQLHVAVSVHERFHRFREVSGVPAIEAAVAELNARLAARGAHLHVTSANGNLAVYSQHLIDYNAAEFVHVQCAGR